MGLTAALTLGKKNEPPAGSERRAQAVYHAGGMRRRRARRQPAQGARARALLSRAGDDASRSRPAQDPLALFEDVRHALHGELAFRRGRPSPWPAAGRPCAASSRPGAEPAGTRPPLPRPPREGRADVGARPPPARHDRSVLPDGHDVSKRCAVPWKWQKPGIMRAFGSRCVGPVHFAEGMRGETATYRSARRGGRPGLAIDGSGTLALVLHRGPPDAGPGPRARAGPPRGSRGAPRPRPSPAASRGRCSRAPGRRCARPRGGPTAFAEAPAEAVAECLGRPASSAGVSIRATRLLRQQGAAGQGDGEAGHRPGPCRRARRPGSCSSCRRRAEFRSSPGPPGRSPGRDSG